MRTQRILFSLMAFALIGLVPVAFVPSAEAAAKPKRDISVTYQQTGNRGNLKGKVKPGARTKIIIQKRGKDQKKWSPATTRRTDAKGRYSYKPPLGRVGTTTCYRIVVPGNKSYRKSFQAKFTYGTVNGESIKGAPMCITTSRA